MPRLMRVAWPLRPVRLGRAGGMSLAVAIALCCLAWRASAASVVSGVAGTIAQRQVITINGSAFGPAPNVVLFDDFESGTAGNAIMTGPGSAVIGQWHTVSGPPRYTDSWAVSGSLSFQADMSNGFAEFAECLLPANTRDFFISWWMSIPAGDRIPGEGTHDTTNWKTIWVLGADTADDDLTLPTFLDTSKVIGGNNSPYTRWMTLDFQKGEWKRLWVWNRGGYDNDGQCHYWELDDPNGVIQRVNDNNVTMMYPGGFRERVHVNGYGRTTPNCHPGFDDVYIATGPNAQARVEIGNNPIYDNCTALAISAPTGWSDTSITATCNVGGLDPAEDWYLFVVDSSGTPSAGYKVHGSYHLAVTNGSGDGDYDAGAVVAISADPAPSGKAFGIWVGNSATVANTHVASTTVTMPAADVSVTAGYVWVYQLTVNSGAGDGSYTSGTVVDIFADPAPSGQVFDQWTGDTAGIANVADPLAATTTVTMPLATVEVTATYKAVTIPGDLNGDGFVGQGDLDIVLDQWGCGDPPADPITDSRADPSGDGFVGQTDLDIVLDHWGDGI